MNAVLHMQPRPILAVLTHGSDEPNLRIVPYAWLRCLQLYAKARFRSYDLDALKLVFLDQRPWVRRMAYRTAGAYGEAGAELLSKRIERAGRNPLAIDNDEITVILRVCARNKTIASRCTEALVTLIPAFCGSSWGYTAERAYQECMTAAGAALLDHLPKMLEKVAHQSFSSWRSPHFFLGTLERSYGIAPEVLLQKLMPFLQSDEPTVRSQALSLMLRPIRRFRLEHELKKGQVTVVLYELRSELNLMIFAERDERVLRTLREVTKTLEG